MAEGKETLSNRCLKNTIGRKVSGTIKIYKDDVDTKRRENLRKKK